MLLGGKCFDIQLEGERTHPPFRGRVGGWGRLRLLLVVVWPKKAEGLENRNRNPPYVCPLSRTLQPPSVRLSRQRECDGLSPLR